ncbi:hypothetical protein FOMPIDRAFT_1021494 [Fomitopsis schrenkii]|uniref:Uncharacterized protein n=1 Tax=Fomitopsis schrenkii TaxID=2126942 RepID=S8EIX4_FOMSC|nr:hypothetical protein FOMPIDRAFT_1021494 [Fomitopsis schrenkii]
MPQPMEEEGFGSAQQGVGGRSWAQTALPCPSVLNTREHLPSVPELLRHKNSACSSLDTYVHPVHYGTRGLALCTVQASMLRAVWRRLKPEKYLLPIVREYSFRVHDGGRKCSRCSLRPSLDDSPFSGRLAARERLSFRHVSVRSATCAHEHTSNVPWPLAGCMDI